MSVIDLGHEHGLTLRQVEILHGSRRILGPVSLGVPPGEVVTVMGPSGCGKSSLLAAICGTLDAALSSRGRVLLNGQAIHDRPPASPHNGILFTNALLLPPLYFATTLALGPQPNGVG